MGREAGLKTEHVPDQTALVRGESAPAGYPVSKTACNLLKRASHLEQRQHSHDFDGFDPRPSEQGTKHIYDAAHGVWKEERVTVEIEKQPFGKGAIRECFRMREVDGPGSGRLYVAKQSMTEHSNHEEHRAGCRADVVQQETSKHHAELFNALVREKSTSSGLGRCGAHSIDFLMAYVLELADGRTFGVEAFVSGTYVKHNNNSGGVFRAGSPGAATANKLLSLNQFRPRHTPQAFSYYTFVQSGYRFMVVDIQGVEDLYTDPVMHFLPEHNPQFQDQTTNLGVRGFALFLWSHRYNPIDNMLGLPPFKLALSEQGAMGHKGTLTIAQLAKNAPVLVEDSDSPVMLSQVPGVDLRPRAWSSGVFKVRAPSDFNGVKLPLDLVTAACHMEIAVMYHESRIGEGGSHAQEEAEAAVFHLVKAAKYGLLEAVLAFARVCSGFDSEGFLQRVQGGAEYGLLCLTLLERAAEAGSLAAMGSLAELLSCGTLCSQTKKTSMKAAKYFESFALALSAAPAVTQPDEKQDAAGASSVHGSTFGWENHGLEAHSAYAKAAEILIELGGKENRVRARELWEWAAEAALENPCLGKKAMRYTELAEAVEDESEEGADESGTVTLTVNDVDCEVIAQFEQFAASFGSRAEAFKALVEKNSDSDT